MKKIFPTKAKSAYEAISEAQRIAFAPVVFQAVRALRDLGILAALDSAEPSGATIDSIASELCLSRYGVQVLIESGLSVGVVESTDDRHFTLSKVGYFLLHDRMTRVNMDFNHFVCYEGMFNLEQAIVDGRPAGLSSIDQHHSTVYEALPFLPEAIKSSWYAFDHFYSDAAYPAALKLVLAGEPKTLVDIGANQGRFSILAAQTHDEIRVTMVDLPEQLAQAVALVEHAGFSRRVDAVGMDVRLEGSTIPQQRDAYWLSQFLCCFSESEIVSLLERIATAMAPTGGLYILETCWDRQQHEAASFSLVNTSPYFTCIANGNSKMFTSSELLAYIERSGLRCERVTDGLGNYHTLFECRLAE